MTGEVFGFRDLNYKIVNFDKFTQVSLCDIKVSSKMRHTRGVIALGKADNMLMIMDDANCAEQIREAAKKTMESIEVVVLNNRSEMPAIVEQVVQASREGRKVFLKRTFESAESGEEPISLDEFISHLPTLGPEEGYYLVDWETSHAHVDPYNACLLNPNNPKELLRHMWFTAVRV